MKSLSFWLFRVGQRLGLNITPNHYYVPLADSGYLQQTREKWARASAMVGVSTDLDSQLAAMERMILPYRDEYADNRAFREATGGHFGPGYGPTEAQALHGFLRHNRPRRIVEIGSGVSTYCMLKATEDYQPEIHCIEPNPRPFLRGANVSLHETVVEHMDPRFFEMLEGGGIFSSSTAVMLYGRVAT